MTKILMENCWRDDLGRTSVYQLLQPQIEKQSAKATSTLEMPLNFLRANKVLAETVNTQASPYHQLQKTPIAQNPTEAALEVSERGRTRALVDLLAKRRYRSASTHRIRKLKML